MFDALGRSGFIFPGTNKEAIVPRHEQASQPPRLIPSTALDDPDGTGSFRRRWRIVHRRSLCAQGKVQDQPKHGGKDGHNHGSKCG
ncbi:hypothetical protein IscW_ISCW012857 [Ixodes scapularis]|uniref:Uncharacterized protein n=1 Tax=Ixodes scapularis TaxID=6945 RepID=B7QDI2_IXOSC|nr:hypothetical protein IscW_ISCW012857 [Ixodes scapularis]|eukprot:XP_002413596.1 hypothetical protein IscW_ISCW012857 [Ixodes scapularis]